MYRFVTFLVAATAAAYLVIVGYAFTGSTVAADASYALAAVAALLGLKAVVNQIRSERRYRYLVSAPDLDHLDEAGEVSVLLLLAVIVVAAIAGVVVLTALHDVVPAVISGVLVAALAGKLALISPAAVVAQPNSSTSSSTPAIAVATPAAAVPSPQVANAGPAIIAQPGYQAPPGQ